MPYYSLYYYQRAAAIKPHDSRMWTALASAYESLAAHSGPIQTPSNAHFSTPIPTTANDRILSAIRCYKRALLGSEDIPFALIKLARLYKSLNDRGAAHFYFDLVYRSRSRLGAQGPSLDEFAEACLWLAQEAKDDRDYAGAEAYAREVEENEEARGIIREVRSILATLGQGAASRRQGTVVS
jgi:anaphase-promoting complex subunit 8